MQNYNVVPNIISGKDLDYYLICLIGIILVIKNYIIH